VVSGFSHPYNPDIHEVFAIQDGYYLRLTVQEFIPTKEDIETIQGQGGVGAPKGFQVTCYPTDVRAFQGLTSTRFFGPENVHQAVYVFLSHILDESTELGQKASENVHHYFHKAVRKEPV
jgi:hypothetical protein